MNSYKCKICINVRSSILLISLSFSIFANSETKTGFDKESSNTNSNASEMATNQEGKLKQVFEEYKKFFPNATNLPNTEEAKKEFKPPTVISSNAPTYPDLLRRRGIEGQVYVALLLDEAGRVIDTLIAQSSNQNLNEAAVQTVMSWQFTPALISNTPKKSVVIAPISFQINKRNANNNDSSSAEYPPINPVLPNLQYLP